MSPPPRHPGYSIAAVSKLTGVSCHALRVWERRYGFPIPERSGSGHRRYGKDQVAVLRQLAKMARSGKSIGVLIGEFQAGLLKVRGEETTPIGESAASTPVVERLFEGDVSTADLLLDALADRLTALELVERVLEPALVDVGERWYRGEVQVFQERIANSMLMSRIWRMLDQARRANPRPTRTILVGSVQGDRHEGGVLLTSLSMELAGWRALPMGTDLSVEEYQKAVEAWDSDALGISFVHSGNVNKRFRELSKIRGVPVFIGGRSIVNHQTLARRNGLIPLIGSLKVCTKHLIDEVEERERRGATATDTTAG